MGKCAIRSSSSTWTNPRLPMMQRRKMPRRRIGVTQLEVTVSGQLMERTTNTLTVPPYVLYSASRISEKNRNIPDDWGCNVSPGGSMTLEGGSKGGRRRGSRQSRR